jgi:glycine/D-amino acid oxidase-like deaminating enzyme
MVSLWQVNPDPYYSYGHGHIGLTWAAVCARAGAPMMLREKPDMELEPFSLTHFR